MSPRTPTAVRRIGIFMRLDPVKGVERVFPAVERLREWADLTAVAWGPLTDEYVRRYGNVMDFVEPVPHQHQFGNAARRPILIDRAGKARLEVDVQAGQLCRAGSGRNRHGQVVDLVAPILVDVEPSRTRQREHDDVGSG